MRNARFKAIFWGLFFLPLAGAQAQGITNRADEKGQTIQPYPEIFLLANVPGRKTIDLNGKWQCIIDPMDIGIGNWTAIWMDRKPQGKTDFFEYDFEGGTVLDVPGDFNSQVPYLSFYESTVWYKKKFLYKTQAGKRLFICFDGVNYMCDVFINSVKAGSHEGGFTPFHLDISSLVKEGENSVIVRVNNQRQKDGIPSLGYDWFNYGGITRDVRLVETPATFIKDYFVQLKKGNANRVEGWIQLDGQLKQQEVTLTLMETGTVVKAKTDTSGFARIGFDFKGQLWSPDNPRLYNVAIRIPTDSIKENIGFRSIEVKGTDILLNGKSVFLKGVNFHEEIPQRMGRAYSEPDALQLLTWAKDLGCNFVRLAHYPQNEYIVRLAEKMGIMLWEEIPVYQGIEFGNERTQNRMHALLNEMISRDKNRCGIIIWSMSNETAPGAARNASIIKMIDYAKSLDKTRLIASAFDRVDYAGNTVTISDTLSKYLDVLSVNEYLGWYRAWPDKPEQMTWKSGFNKPLIMSEFGGEALFGNHGSKDTASLWTEEFQEQLYRDQLSMLKTIPFLKGTCPWLLIDFRSPKRLHPKYQDGAHGMWNRKGLLSDKGHKKRAWFVMAEYYKTLE